jgi:hypothetical protein
MRTQINRVSDMILNATIFSIGIISIIITIFVFNSLNFANMSKDEVDEAQTYTRFNSCAIAQRSYKGAAALNKAELDYCWDLAEKATHFKVERYYGKEIK